MIHLIVSKFLLSYFLINFIYPAKRSIFHTSFSINIIIFPLLLLQLFQLLLTLQLLLVPLLLQL